MSMKSCVRVGGGELCFGRGEGNSAIGVKSQKEEVAPTVSRPELTDLQETCLT